MWGEGPTLADAHLHAEMVATRQVPKYLPLKIPSLWQDMLCFRCSVHMRGDGYIIDRHHRLTDECKRSIVELSTLIAETHWCNIGGGEIKNRRNENSSL